MTPSEKLRNLLAGDALLVAPGAYDALTARLVEQAGFDTVYMTGAGTAAAHGFPDYGILSGTEMADNAGFMADSISIPLIADADTGYGNELNVTRTIRDLERRGVAGIHLEDQVSPKRCGHLDGKDVIPTDEYIGKVKAAVEARSSSSFYIIARTDARAVAGLDEAIKRAKLALDAGADMAFVEATQSLEEMAAVPAQVPGPCLLNVVPGGKTPHVSYEDAQQMGYKLALCPGVILRAVVPTVDAALVALKADGLPAAEELPSGSLMQTFRRFGASEWDACAANTRRTASCCGEGIAFGR